MFTEVATDLRFWAEHGSWVYCTHCGSLQSKKLLPAYRKRHHVRAALADTRSHIRGEFQQSSKI